MSYAAIVGAVVAAGATAYGAYTQNQAVEAANSVHPRAFVPININRTATLARAADEAGFRLSDADFAKRFPQLVQGRNFNIADSISNLGGGTSNVVSDSLSRAGLSADLGNDEFKKAQALGKPILSIEQRDRNYFSRMLAENPQRTAGLSGGDVTKLAAQNTGALGAYNSQIFGNKINSYNAQIAQGIQNTSAATSGLASLAGLFTQNNRTQQSPYLNAGYSGGHSVAGGLSSLGYTSGPFNSSGG